MTRIRGNKMLVRWIAAGLLPALVLWGCANMTPQEKAAWGAAGGALLGAAVGAAVSDDSGKGALIGAAGGALVGGAVGYFVGKYQEKQIATREQVEREMKMKQAAAQPVPADGSTAPQPVTPVPEVPTVQIENVIVTPNTVTGGSDVTVNATYVAYGPREQPPTGTIQLVKDNVVLDSSPLQISSTGRVEIMKTLSLPPDAASGPYVVVIVLQHGPSQDQRQSTFNVS